MIQCIQIPKLYERRIYTYWHRNHDSISSEAGVDSDVYSMTSTAFYRKYYQGSFSLDLRDRSSVDYSFTVVFQGCRPLMKQQQMNREVLEIFRHGIYDLQTSDICRRILIYHHPRGEHAKHHAMKHTLII